MPDYDAKIESLLPELVAFRRDLHMHPELGYEETRTAGRLVEALEKISGLDVRAGIAKTGIVATLNADRGGPCVALRADMDALPLTEANEFEHRSQNEGKMHACGHDGHMACLLGAARVLAESADELPGVVKFIFQPAEEGGAGGRRMVEAGVLTNPTVDAAFALHGWPSARLGSIITGTGPVLAAATAFSIHLAGQGAHAAYPHEGTDLILASAHIINALQAIPARFTCPVEPVVVSITSIQAGAASNVLPDRCRMLGTTRAMDQAVHEQTKDHIRQAVDSVASLFGITATVSYDEAYPALVNDAMAAELVADAAVQWLGSECVQTDPPPTMGGEDFSFFAEEVPSAFWRLGLCPPDRDDYPRLHSPNFDFVDEVIPIGVGLHCRIAERFLRQNA